MGLNFNLFKDYFNFTGKSSRLEYGCYQLGYFILILSIYFYKHYFGMPNQTVAIFFSNQIITLLTFIPLQAVTTRRLRDLGLNGGMIFLNFIPVLNIIFSAFLLFTNKTEEVEIKVFGYKIALIKSKKSQNQNLQLQ